MTSFHLINLLVNDQKLNSIPHITIDANDQTKDRERRKKRRRIEAWRIFRGQMEVMRRKEKTRSTEREAGNHITNSVIVFVNDDSRDILRIAIEQDATREMESAPRMMQAVAVT